MNEIAKRIAEIALDIKAIKLQPNDPFTWASGLRMPLYNDNRLLLGSAAHRRAVTDGFEALFRERYPTGGIDVIAGTSTAGIPWGVALADRVELPFVYVREKPKTHGKKKRVEGVLPQGARVLLVEDLISTGGSSVSALLGVREEGGTIDTCLSIFSYCFPEAEDQFRQAQATYRSLLRFPELLEIAQERKAITPADVAVLDEWSRSPLTWGAAHGFPPVVKEQAA
ncbi:MAG: orotate phosphoribosyltransferase [Deltaproteobacteria bacterium]|nr:orotate phosphoribosyltransferase [Deltaproteobacteria bacterium]